MKFKMVENGVQTDVDYGQLSISSDETKGFRPFQLMIASIVGCSSMVLTKILDKQRIEVTELTVEAEAQRNPKEANRIEQLSINFFIKGPNLEQTKLEKTLKIARKNCAMVRSVEDSIDIQETIEILT